MATIMNQQRLDRLIEVLARRGCQWEFTAWLLVQKRDRPTSSGLSGREILDWVWRAHPELYDAVCAAVEHDPVTDGPRS